MLGNKAESELSIIITIILLVLGIFLLFSFRIVDYNEYAFEKEFGKLDNSLRDQGITYVGIGKLVRINNQIRNYEIEINAPSKDLQEVKIVLNLNLRIKRDKSYDFVLNYKDEETYQQYLNNKVQEKTKIVSLRYKAEDFIHQREKISSELFQEITSINELNYFEINDIALKDIDFSDQFNTMLEKKAQVEIERDVILKQQENIRLINQNINMTNIDAYFKYRIAEKWDGSTLLTMID